jgi:flagellar motility protein MotE (MotC chaperone)
MKSVVVISIVTFALIFGGVVLVIQRLPQSAGPVAEVSAVPEQQPESADRVLQNLALERDRVQREREQLLVAQQELAVQQTVLDAAAGDMRDLIQRLQAEQQVYSEVREKSARKLAKMYENMKPNKAAPILASLGPDVVLEIMQRMNEKAAAKILAQMDAGLAAQVSLRMSLKGDQ